MVGVGIIRRWPSESAWHSSSSLSQTPGKKLRMPKRLGRGLTADVHYYQQYEIDCLPTTGLSTTVYCYSSQLPLTVHNCRRLLLVVDDHVHVPPSGNRAVEGKWQPVSRYFCEG